MSQQFTLRQIEAFTEAAKRFGKDKLRVPAPPENRLGSEKLFRSLEGLTPKQIEIHNDPNKYISMCCTRRAGKTYLAAPWFVELGMKAKDSETTMFFIGPTLQHAKALLWRRFQAVQKETNLDFTMRADPWRIEFPTGAILYFRGASDMTELGAVVGFKTSMVWVDECQDIPDGVLRYIAQKVGPGLRDLGGKMVFSGTPGLVCAGHWYDVSTGREKHWSRHFFTLYENPHLPPDAKDLNVILREEGLTPEMPRFKREYMGQWVEDDTAQCYRFDLLRNGQWGFDRDLPAGHEWEFVMGVDWGFRPDPSAVVVLAYSRTHPTVHVVYEWQQNDCIYDQVYHLGIKPAIERFGVMPSYADAAAPQAIEELNQRYRLGMQPCTKGNKRMLKAAYIEMANSHLLKGEVQIPPESYLAKELVTLVWDPKKLVTGARKEHPGKPNHSADAFLYALIECKQWADPNPQNPPDPYDVDKPDAKAAYLLQLAAQSKTRNQPLDWANDDFFNQSY